MTRKKNASGKGQTDVLKQTAETDPSTPSKNNGGMVVFIRDNKNRVLQSYTFSPDCSVPLP